MSILLKEKTIFHFANLQFINKNGCEYRFSKCFYSVWKNMLLSYNNVTFWVIKLKINNFIKQKLQIYYTFSKLYA